MITAETTIGEVIWRKGPEVAETLDQFFCFQNKRCCPGTTLQLGYAVKLREKEGEIDSLLGKLNALPDISYKKD